MSADPVESRVRGLPQVESPTTAAELLQLHRARQGRRRAMAIAGGVVSLAAAGLLVVTLSTEAPVRARGAGVAAPVTVRGVIEGPRGARAWRPDEVVARDEAVVVRIDAGGAGLLTVTDGDGRTIWPADGSPWAVEEGAHYLGGEQPLAWRPDGDRSGVHPLVVSLCPEVAAPPEHCTEAVLAVTFE